MEIPRYRMYIAPKFHIYSSSDYILLLSSVISNVLSAQKNTLMRDSTPRMSGVGDIHRFAQKVLHGVYHQQKTIQAPIQAD